jgi:hypothetical protein
MDRNSPKYGLKISKIWADILENTSWYSPKNGVIVSKNGLLFPPKWVDNWKACYFAKTMRKILEGRRFAP